MNKLGAIMENNNSHILATALDKDVITMDELEALLLSHLNVDVTKIDRCFSCDEDFAGFDIYYRQNQNDGAIGIIFNSSDVLVSDVYTSTSIFKDGPRLVDDYLSLLNSKTSATNEETQFQKQK